MMDAFEVEMTFLRQSMTMIDADEKREVDKKFNDDSHRQPL